MRIYLCGPMSGLPQLNFPAFDAAAAKLRSQGHEVLNPSEICTDKTMKWEDCMRKDIAALVTCEAIALLPGHLYSRGATIERTLAEALGMEVIVLKE